MRTWGTLRNLQDQFRQLKTQVQSANLGHPTETINTTAELFNQGLHGLAENFGVAIDVGDGGGGGH